MLFYLFSADELRDVLRGCGYHFDPASIPRTVEFYRARTTHGSTLSSVVHAWVLARGRRPEALRYLVDTLESDSGNVQGGTTGEGIHLAAMAASVDILQRCFAGLEIRDDALFLNPFWPAELGQLTFEVNYRDHLLRLTVTGTTVRVEYPAGSGRPVRIGSPYRTVDVSPGQAIHLAPP
jgi:trehalose 6-phosphate phosphatase